MRYLVMPVVLSLGVSVFGCKSSGTNAAVSEAVEARPEPKMLNPFLERVAIVVEGTYHEGDSHAEVYRISYEPKRGRSFQALVKETIYRVRSADQYARPDTVKVELKAHDQGSIATLAEAATRHGSIVNKEINRDLVKSDLLLARNEDQTLKFYEVQDSNSFGSCSNAVVVDSRNRQILIAGSCMTE